MTVTEASDRLGPFFGCTAENSSWHGTMTSSLIGAVTNNGVGMAGVAWAIMLLPVRVLGKCGGFDSDIIAGMQWAAGLLVPGVPANANPARVINMSLGGAGMLNTGAAVASVLGVSPLASTTTTKDIRSYIPAGMAKFGYYGFIRIINVGTTPTAIHATFIDGDTGVTAASGQLTASLAAGAAVTFSAQEIEAALGSAWPASSRPRVLVTGSAPLDIQSFQANPNGVITQNGSARTGTAVPVQSYIPEALSVSGYRSFVRVINNGTQSTPVSVSLIDASTGQTRASGQLTASLPANAAITFSAQQIEAALGLAVAAQDRPRILVTSPSGELSVQWPSFSVIRTLEFQRYPNTLPN